MSSDRMSIGREQRKIFVESLYDAMIDSVAPLPIFKMPTETGENLEFLDGRSTFPSEDSYEITATDINIASTFFDDLSILYEGGSGTGKTHSAETLFEALYGGDNYMTLQFENGSFGESALKPFTESEIQNGNFDKYIVEESTSKHGGIFLDEFNRSDFNEMRQIVDGTIQVNDQEANLGIPIQGTNRVKPPNIIAAQNPSTGEYSGTRENDLAANNRFVKIPFPNGVGDFASAQLGKNVSDDIHQEVWDDVKEELGTEKTWKELYPHLTDPERIDTELDGRIREFIDVSMGYVVQNPESYYEDCMDALESRDYGRNVVLTENDLDKLNEKLNGLRQEIVPRDIDKIGAAANLLGMIKGIKQGGFEIDTGLTEATAALGIVLEGKRESKKDYGDLLGLAAGAGNAYDNIIDEHAGPLDNRYGLRNAVYQSSVDAWIKQDRTYFFDTIADNIDQLNSGKPGEGEEAIVKSRLAADLAFLEEFSERYSDDMEEIIEDSEKEEEVYEKFEVLYNSKKSGYTAYSNRLGPVFRC